MYLEFLRNFLIPSLPYENDHIDWESLWFQQNAHYSVEVPQYLDQISLVTNG